MRKIRTGIIAFCLLSSITFLSAQNSRFFYHTVTSGQGVYSIARMYNVSEQEIYRLNPGSERVIIAGQQLRIPQITDSYESTKFHTVQPGETLYKLSFNNNVTVKEICDANPGLSIENFQAGQVIIIPSSSKSSLTPPEVIADDIVELPEEVSNAVKTLVDTFLIKTTHLVERRENIYRISTLYNITQEELIEANPILRNSKLQTGSILNIPYSAKELLERSELRIKADNIINSIDNATLFDINRPEIKNFDGIRAALILPFLLSDSANVDQKKMVEFYQGALLALDKLKDQGISVSLSIFDSGNAEDSISHILSSPGMSQMNIIFGPRYPEHIKQVSNFSKEHNIPLILPISSNDDEVYNNPYIFQLNTPQSYFMSEIYNHFFEHFKNPRVIFLDAGDFSRNSFVEGLKPALLNHNIPFITMMVDTSSQMLIDTLSSEHHNIFIINSTKSAPLTNTLPILQLVTRLKSPLIKTTLFGYPEYQIYAADNLDEMFEVDTYFYSWFYTNNLLPNAVEFQSRFRNSFSRNIMISYPSFASYGYDLVYFFLKALNDYGTDFSNNLDKIQTEPVQVGFKFERVNNWGGFINRKVFFVHFAQDYNVEILDFDK